MFVFQNLVVHFNHKTCVIIEIIIQDRQSPQGGGEDVSDNGLERRGRVRGGTGGAARIPSRMGLRSAFLKSTERLLLPPEGKAVKPKKKKK